jgi:hypothetical protein
MMKKRKEPRWVTPFLRALERTGKARGAAEDAGVDHSTAYARRKAHGEFAAAWLAALEGFRAAREEAQAAEMAEMVGRVCEANGRAPALSRPLRGCPSSAEGGGADGEELIVSGGRLKRASGERWGKLKAEAFLTELATNGIVRRACKAVGISYNAVNARRKKDPHLDAACHAAIAACRARMPEFLAGAAAATFDPDVVADAETGALPKMSIDQAIKIAQMNLPSGAEGQIAPYDVEGVRDRLEKKLRVLGLIDDQALERACPHCQRTFRSPGADAADATGGEEE